MDVRVGSQRKLSAQELMLLSCGVEEDSWESLGLQDQTSQSLRKSILNIHWKDWCWSWSSNTLATSCKEPIIRKHLDAEKNWTQVEMETTEDEHHWLNGHEFEQTLEDREGQGSLVWGHKESCKTERLNRNNTLEWEPLLQYDWCPYKNGQLGPSSTGETTMWRWKQRLGWCLRGKECQGWSENSSLPSEGISPAAIWSWASSLQNWDNTFLSFNPL